jgi:hypothetical protein
MMSGFSVSVNPIGPWPLLVGCVLAVLGLTLWAYARKLKTTAGAWKWFALGLRLLALLMCLLAALRPSVVMMEKKQQAATVVFLVDSSGSMKVGDEVRGQKRSEVAAETIRQAREAAKSFGPNLDTRFYRFDSTIAELPEEGLGETEGPETRLGTALMEAEKRQAGKRVAQMVVVSDFSSNNGVNPLVAARYLGGQQVPVVTIPVGTENTTAGSRDIAVRDIAAGPTVFVKNKLEVRGTLSARGFGNQAIDVELFVEDQPTAVARTQLRVPDGAQSVPITGLNFVPQTPGEKKVTLRASPKEGEFLVTNNEVSTFVSVLSGGLNVLFIQGPNFSWEKRFLSRAIQTSPDIELDYVELHRPARGDTGDLEDDRFTPGRYDVYILGDISADFLTQTQHALLKEVVARGAGLMMLGGRSSFGPGGWGQTPLAAILPADLHPGDGQLEPEGGVKFVPSRTGLDSYVLQVGSSPAETAAIWERMPNLTGANLFGTLKQGAIVLAETGGATPEPIMIGMDVPGGSRVLAFGGETWVWYRATEEGRLAHRKFWRQVIFWLSHKEDKGENEVKLVIDHRRLSVGQKLEMTVTAHDAKGAPIPNLRYETKVESEGESPTSEAVELYNQGNEARGAYYATGKPGNYQVTVVAKRGDEVIGRDTSRFLVYQDDRELENPAADLGLARQIAEATSGETLAPEKLANHLKGIDQSAYTEYSSPTEHRIWDNWPFLLIFATLLTLEWWLRKRHGWV